MPERRRKHLARSRRPMLADVAKAAGVSTASVSRALNAPHTVKPKTLKRITAAIEQLGYLPDGAARALASGHQRTIGAVVPTLDNAIFASCINALQRRLAKRHFALLVASSDYNQTEELREVTALTVHGVAGLFLVGGEHASELYEMLDRHCLPYVNTWSYAPDSKYPSIGFDNYAAAKRVTDYLLDLGHKKIAILAGLSQHNDRVKQRINGAIDTMAQRGVNIRSEYLQELPYDIRRGREALRELWELSDKPTAIICGNDVLAYGALLESQSLGIRVPDHLSIVGFDDLPMSGNWVPPLTTIRVPAVSIGLLAADYLVDSLETEEPPIIHTELDADLVVRSTTGPPRKN